MIPDQEHLRTIRSVTWTGLVVNVFLAGFKLSAGAIGSSQAVVADGFHSLSDLFSDLIIIFGVRFWLKPADDQHPHGHRKIENMATIAIGALLVLTATALLWNGIATLQHRHDQPPGWIALAAAAISIPAKEILYRWTLKKGRSLHSAPLIANAWHHRSDALSSVPAVLAVGGAVIFPAWSFLDHLGAVVISLFIYQAAYKIVHPAFHKLIDSGASPEEVARIENLAAQTPGVLSVHKIRTRYTGCSCMAVDLHIEVDGSLSVIEGHNISETVKKRLIQSDMNIRDVIVHLEPYRSGPPD